MFVYLTIIFSSAPKKPQAPIRHSILVGFESPNSQAHFDFLCARKINKTHAGKTAPL